MFGKLFADRQQQAGRRQAGLMGQGVGQGLARLRNDLQPGNGLGQKYGEDLRRIQEDRDRAKWQSEMQARGNYQPVLGQSQPNMGIPGGGAALGGLTGQQQPMSREAYINGMGRAQEAQAAGRVGGLGARWDMNPMRSREQIRQAMAERLATGMPKRETSAGKYRMAMLERARKRQMMGRRMRRRNRNPFFRR